LVCPAVTSGISNSPASYTVSGLPNSPIASNAVTITSGTVQLDLDLGPAGQAVPAGSYTVSATATNTNGTSAASANFGLTVTPFVQGANVVGTATAVGSVSLAYGSNEAAGNTNVVCVYWYKASSPPTISSITDTNGNSYTLAKSELNYNTGNNEAVYYATGIAAGANTVTVNFSASTATYASIMETEYSWLGALDAAAGATGASGTSLSSGNLTTTVTGDQLIGFQVGNSAFTVGTGYTQRISSGSGNWVTEDKAAGAAGSYSATSTQASSGGWSSICVAFKP
jgi:hypothetical protein